MASNGLKMEAGLVKNEPGMDDLDMADVDDVHIGGYEDDTGELIISSALSRGWLLRVPKDLWTLLSDPKISDDAEVTLGEVRIWKPQNNTNTPGAAAIKGREKDKETVRLNLAPSIPGKDLSLIPKQYDLTSTSGNAITKNTFIFSEKNLPGFKPRSHLARTAKQEDALRGVDSREGSVSVQKPRGPRTIPKRTEYLCTASRELVCTPRDNAEYRHIEQVKRTQKATNRTAFINDETQARHLQNVGMQGSLTDESFIYTGSSVSARKKAQDNKATRMPEVELVEALSACFREFKYWPMSALKKRLRQPEAWLKEVLGKIAVLVRTGQAANHYMLLKAYEEGAEAEGVKEEDIAPEVKGEEGEDEDEEMEFEDA